MKRFTSRSYPTLKLWRQDHELTTRQAATLLGMTQSKYSRLERRVTLAAGPLAKQLTQQTGVPLEVLVGAA